MKPAKRKCIFLEYTRLNRANAAKLMQSEHTDMKTLSYFFSTFSFKILDRR